MLKSQIPAFGTGGLYKVQRLPFGGLPLDLQEI